MIIYTLTQCVWLVHMQRLSLILNCTHSRHFIADVTMHSCLLPFSAIALPKLNTCRLIQLGSHCISYKLHVYCCSCSLQGMLYTTFGIIAKSEFFCLSHASHKIDTDWLTCFHVNQRLIAIRMADWVVS